MTLETFLSTNRAELIKRTRAKVASRSSPQTNEIELEQGVPLFLSQLSATLKDLEGVKDEASTPHPAKAPTISQSAAVHGLNLLKFGFTIEQVVHDYGDVCQAVTELAQERGATLSIVEFQTLNRCLDNAIAGAVTSWSQGRERDVIGEANEANEGKESDALKTRLVWLLDQAQGALTALRAGTVGVNGATAEVLHRSLIDLRALIATGK